MPVPAMATKVDLSNPILVHYNSVYLTTDNTD